MRFRTILLLSLLLPLPAFVGMSMEQAQANPAYQKWEYMKLDTSNPVVTFDTLGQKGWELVSVDRSMGYFKRKAQ